MKVIVVRGMPGTGKSRLRASRTDWTDFPQIDLADLRDEQEEHDLGSYKAYKERMHRLFNWLHNRLAEKCDTVIVEGIFAPQSDSERWLIEWAADNGVELSAVTVRYPLEECLKRIYADWQSDNDTARYVGRLEILLRHKDSFK